MSEYHDIMEYTVDMLLDAINEANEQLGGYFNHLADEDNLGHYLRVLEKEPIKRVGTGEWEVSYSQIRDEVYVYDANGKQVFMIPSEDLTDEVKLLNEIELQGWVEERYKDELIELGLIEVD